MTSEKISPLRRRMMEDMRIRGMGEKAQKGHIRAIKDFAAFLGRAPDAATPEDLRADPDRGVPLEGLPCSEPRPPEAHAPRNSRIHPPLPAPPPANRLPPHPPRRAVRKCGAQTQHRDHPGGSRLHRWRSTPTPMTAPRRRRQDRCVNPVPIAPRTCASSRPVPRGQTPRSRAPPARSAA